jgi:hypothetical protein
MPRGSHGPKGAAALRYDGFVLALDLLFLMGAIELRDGVLHRSVP